MPKKVIILRGISGSGKSTYCKTHFPDGLVVSADNFFIDEYGIYRFNPANLGAAHSTCFQQFVRGILNDEVKTVIVDNTNTTLWEFKNYVDFAMINEDEIQVIRLVVSPEIAAARNQHGVPASKIQQMQNRFKDYPGETLVDTTTF